MVILVKRTLLVFAFKHPEASRPLNNWYDIANAADWSKLADIKKVLIAWTIWVTTGMFLILKEMILGLLR